MSDLSGFSDVAKNNLCWDDIAQHQGWIDKPEFWDQWQHQNPSEAIAQGDDVYLFCTHKFHKNPDLRERESDNLVHAASAPVIPGAIKMKQYDARSVYGGSQRFSFLTVYKAQEGQAFYNDEGLEYAEEDQNTGIAIEDIEKFDPKIAHFETDADGCEVAGVYVMTMPLDRSARGSPKPVDEDAIRLLRIDNNPALMAFFDRQLALRQSNKPAPDVSQPETS